MDPTGLGATEEDGGKRREKKINGKRDVLAGDPLPGGGHDKSWRGGGASAASALHPSSSKLGLGLPAHPFSVALSIQFFFFFPGFARGHVAGSSVRDPLIRAAALLRP